MDARGVGSEGSEIAQDFLGRGDESVRLGTGDECAIRAEAAVEKRFFKDWEISLGFAARTTSPPARATMGK